MEKPVIIFDSFQGVDPTALRWLVDTGRSVFVVEPFIAYHRVRAKYAGYPKDFPAFVKGHIKTGKIKLIPAASFDAKTIYVQAADLAVEAVVAVFPSYALKFKNLFEFIQSTLGAETALNAFKNYLSQRLAEFYGLNIFLYRLEKQFPGQDILFFSDVNVRQYHDLADLLRKNRQTCYESTRVSFPSSMERYAFDEQVKNSFFMISVLFVQCLLGFGMDLWRWLDRRSPALKKYKYGITVIAPGRQLKNAYGRADFLVDNEIIHEKEVVYLPLATLSAEQKRILSQLPGNVYEPPNPKRFFSHGVAWLKLFLIGIGNGFPFNGGEMKTAYLILSRYFLWKHTLKQIHFQHLITHCDFGSNHVGRNIALKQAGVETWYFTDSMNIGCSWRQEGINGQMRHPFWTYLTYDHFVTWSEGIKEFFQSHPNDIQQYHVVGCLWSQNDSKSAAPDILRKSMDPDKRFFIIGAFDTTYSLNGYATYEEGILFAQHLLEMVKREEDVVVVLKEKKDRTIHDCLDPDLTPRFLEIYESLAQHPRIKVFSRLANTGELLDSVDMVISFPFTSTTFEALSRRVPALWHDPWGCYQDTPYGKFGQVMTHGFDHLLAKVRQVKTHSREEFFASVDFSSNLMDPFNDRKSVERFRRLLVCGKEEFLYPKIQELTKITRCASFSDPASPF